MRARSRPAARTPSQELARLVRDPVLFTRGLLRQDPWAVQERILRSIDENPRTAVKACHASGKTHVAAQAVQWWTLRYADGIVVTTAPTWTQVERLLWGEIHKSSARSRIAFPKLNKTELPIGPENYAIGLSTNEGVRFQGWHGRILIVLDEAPGVLPEIWEAIEGIRAGGYVHVLALGNPLIASGPFYDAFGDHRATWEPITISAFDTPNLRGVSLEQLLAMSPDERAIAPRPYLTTRQWVWEKYHEWGPGHPLWEAKVLGEFPSQASNALVSLAWLERAKARKGAGTGRLRGGLDVAGPGEDETVLTIVDGPDIAFQQGWSKPDPRGEVLAALRPFKSRLEVVNYDNIGIGYYFGPHLADAGIPVRGINVGEASYDPERFANYKAELSWGFRMRAEEDDLGGFTSDKTIGQLAGITYSHNARGQIVIESKDELKKRGVKSPDYAESVVLAYAPDPPAPRERAWVPPASTSYVSI